MHVKQEEAAAVGRFLLADYEAEMATTRRVIAAVPEGQPEYVPGPKYMTALKLALHLPTADDLFLRGILEGSFAPDKEVEQQVKSIADVLAWFDAKLPVLVEKLKSVPDETWTRELDFFGVFKMTGLQMMSLALKHSIHHRGQLSVYLRPMGGKVPGIYGPSGDDK